MSLPPPGRVPTSFAIVFTFTVVHKVGDFNF